MHRHLLHHHTASEKGKCWLLIGDITGWIGAFVLLGAYLLVSFDLIGAQSIAYQLMNIIGAVGLMILALARRATPSVFVNAIWIIIGLVAIVGIISAISL